MQDMLVVVAVGCIWLWVSEQLFCGCLVSFGPMWGVHGVQGLHLGCRV